MRAAIAVACILTLSSVAQAQSRKAPAKGHDLCVDVATLKVGKSVRGLIMTGDGTANSPWVMAAERDAVQQEQPQLFQRASKAEVDKAIQAYEELNSRIEQELASPDLNLAYKSFLEGELERFAAPLAELQDRQKADSRFMWIELTSKECSNLRRASPDAQRVAVWAWSENVADVTKRDRADLERELAQGNIDLKRKLPDLSRDLPPRPESEEQWQARLAILRYTMTGGIDFQGSNGLYMRAGTAQAAIGPAEMASLFEKMMSSTMESFLMELDPVARANAKANNKAKSHKNANWFSSVTSQAETLSKKEFRITRLDQDASGVAATVETALVAKLPTRGWQIVWSSQQTRRAADVTPAEETQVGNDPQVKAALGLLATLGAGADAEVRKAIRYGAATMQAQKAADADFLQFRDRYVKRLDGPPMQKN